MAWVVSAISAGIDAIGALVGGAALTAATVGTIATGVEAAGVTLSVVGVVTGDKTLSQVGAVMGIAGGLTDFGAGMFADVGGTATQIGSATTDGASTIDPATGAVASTPVTPVTPVTQATDAVAAPVTGSTSPLLNASTPSGVVNGTPAWGGGAAGGELSDTAMAPTPAASTATGGNSLLSNTGKWIGNLPAPQQGMLVTGGLQAGGMALGGLANAYSNSQKMALAQQAQNLAQQQYNTSVASANSPVAIGAPPVPQANPIINNPQPAAAPGSGGMLGVA